MLRARAARSVAHITEDPDGSTALHIAPTRRRRGSASFSSASRLSSSSAFIDESPVTLAPGREKLFTSPSLTGSSAITKTIGIDFVAGRC